MSRYPTLRDMEIKHIVRAAGGPRKLAARLGLKSHSTVVEWRRVPPAHVLVVEGITGIPRHVLRPDIFGMRRRQGGA